MPNRRDGPRCGSPPCSAAPRPRSRPRALAARRRAGGGLLRIDVDRTFTPTASVGHRHGPASPAADWGRPPRRRPLVTRMPANRHPASSTCRRRSSRALQRPRVARGEPGLRPGRDRRVRCSASRAASQVLIRSRPPRTGQRSADLLMLEDGGRSPSCTTSCSPRPAPGRSCTGSAGCAAPRPAPAPGAAVTARHVVVLDADPAGGGGWPRPGAPDLRTRRAATARDPRHRPVWVWRPTGAGPLGGQPGAPSGNELPRTARPGPALAARGPSAPRLWLVTEGAQWLPGTRSGDRANGSAAAGLWGFGRVCSRIPQAPGHPGGPGRGR